MKKFAIAALAAIAATVSLSATADAGERNRGFEWRHESRNDNHNNRGWRDRGFRHDNWRYHGWRHGGWRGGYWGGYWGGPTVVIAPGYSDYCFVKKVRHYDRHGNVYIKRVRVCR